MFCTECGTQIPDGAGFCPKCGTACLKKPAAIPLQPMQAEPEPSRVYTAPPLPPQSAAPARSPDLKAVNGVWLYNREHTLIKVTAILLLVLGGYSILSQLITVALIPSSSVTSTNFIGIAACIGFALAEFRCMRWAFILPVIGRIFDIGMIIYDLSAVVGDSDFIYYMAIPQLQIIMLLESVQLLFELAMLVLLVLAQRPLSAKVQRQR